jgi:hypothetical protein
MKPLESIGETLSNSIFFANSIILLFVYLKALASLIKVVISVNKNSFFWIIWY